MEGPVQSSSGHEVIAKFQPFTPSVLDMISALSFTIWILKDIRVDLKAYNALNNYINTIKHVK